MQIGDRIFQLREEKRLTQKQLAGLIGISRAALSHYENNRRQPDYDTLKKLADYFGVMADDIIGTADDRPLSGGGKQADPDECPEQCEPGAGEKLQAYRIVHLRHAVHPSRLL